MTITETVERDRQPTEALSFDEQLEAIVEKFDIDALIIFEAHPDDITMGLTPIQRAGRFIVDHADVHDEETSFRIENDTDNAWQSRRVSHNIHDTPTRIFDVLLTRGEAGLDKVVDGEIVQKPREIRNSLARTRAVEQDDSLRELFEDIDEHVVVLQGNFPDGGVSTSADDICQHNPELIEEVERIGLHNTGLNFLVVAIDDPHFDGHRDHVAAFATARRFATKLGFPMLQVSHERISDSYVEATDEERRHNEAFVASHVTQADSLAVKMQGAEIGSYFRFVTPISEE